MRGERETRDRIADQGTILHLLPSTVIGGAETMLLELIKQFDGVRHVVMTHSTVARYFSQSGVTVHRFDDLGFDDPMPVTLRKIWTYGAAIARLARRERAACMIGVMYTGCFYGSIARDIFRARIPLIGNLQGNFTAYFEKLGRRPTLSERTMIRYLVRRPGILVACSRGVADDVVQHFGAREARTRVIYNGVDARRIRALAQESSGLPPAGPCRTVVSVCRLAPQKDFQTLLRAFARVRERIEARLVLVGDGPLREEILRDVRLLGLEPDVVLAGFQRNPFPWVAASDVFVLSSFWEGLPCALIEALALGVPVVSSDCPSGPSEIVQHGLNGFLVPVGDVEAMARAIAELLQNGEMREQFARRAAERAELFSAERMVEDFRALVRDVSAVRREYGPR